MGDEKDLRKRFLTLFCMNITKAKIIFLKKILRQLNVNGHGVRESAYDWKERRQRRRIHASGLNSRSQN